MKAILILPFALLALGLGAQDSLIYRYVEVRYPLFGLTTKNKVVIDHGDRVWALGGDPVQMITDEEGKEIKFKSHIHCLNYMTEQGWELVHQYVYENDPNIAGVKPFQFMHYLMRRLERVGE